MAISRIKMRNVYLNNRLKPGNFYTRPVVPVFYRGMQGYGQASQLSRETFEKYLKQRAVSPFAVNSSAYMQEIRKQYGYEDRGTYEVLGTIGGVVGAGVGAMFSAGLLNLPFQTPLTSWKFWKTSSWQDPLDLNKIINKDWNILNSPKRIARHQALFGAPKGIDDISDTALTLGTRTTDKVIDTVDNASDVIKAAKAAGDVTSLAKRGVQTGVRVGAKVGKKTAGFIPYVGTVMDVASLTLSSLAVEQAYRSENASVGLKIATTAELIGDIISVTGDVLELFPPTAPAGMIVSIIGGIVSIAAGAFAGQLIGKTLGRSLSPEGLHAQAMYTENLYAGMMQRPISSIGTIATMFAPALIAGAMSSIHVPNNFSKYFLQPLKNVGDIFSGNAIGIQARAGLTMLAVQGVNQLTTPLDEMLPWAPENPEDVSFVSAVSLMGDINDNLYGATLRKSTLLGLFKNDPDAMVEAFARSWGQSDKPYYSVTFDDIRQAANIELGQFGNSLFSIAGELLIDPQNYTEVVGKISEARAIDTLSDYVIKDMTHKQAAVALKRSVGNKGTIEEAVGKEGLLNPEFIPPLQRKAFFKKLSEAYIKDPTDGVFKFLNQFYTSRVRGYNIEGTNKALQVTALPKNLAYQSNLINTYFKSVTEGTYISSYSVEEMQSIQRRIKRFLKIKSDVESGKEVKDSETVLPHIINTIKRLKEFYGNDSVTDAILFEKFVKDLNLKLDDNKVAEMAMINKDLQYHLDLSDTLGRGINRIANPMSEIVKGSIFAFTKLNEKSRAWTADRKNVARTIVKIDKLIGKGSSIKVYNKEDLEKAYINTGGISKHTDLYNKFAEERINKQARLIADDIKEAIKDDEKKALGDIAQIEKLNQEYQAKADEITKIHDKGIYVLPMEYSFTSNSKISINNLEDLKRIEEQLDAYETEDGKRLSDAALAAKVNNNKDNEDTKLYQQRQIAASHYRSRIFNSQLFGGLYTIQSNITGLLAKTLYKFQDELVGVLYMYSAIRDIASMDPSKNKFDIEQWNNLKKYFSEKSIDPDAFLLRYGIKPFIEIEVDGTTQKLYGFKSVIVAKDKGIPLQIELANIPLTNKITSIVHKALHYNNIESIRQGTIDLYSIIAKEDLRKKLESLEKNPIERYQYIRQLIIQAGNFTDAQYKELFTVDTLTKIYSTIKDELLNGDKKKYVQVNEINIDELRAIVFTKFYNEDNAELKEILETFKSYDTKVTDAINEIKLLYTDKTQTDLQRTMTNIITTFNSQLNYNTAFKFMSAYIRPSVEYIKGDNETRLFLAPNARKDLLPPSITKEQLATLKKTRTKYTEEDILIQLDANKIQQELINTSSRREQSERINAKIFKSSTTYVDGKLTYMPNILINKVEPQEKIEKTQRDSLKTRTLEEASKFVSFLKNPNILESLDVIQPELMIASLKMPTITLKEDSDVALIKYALNTPDKFSKFTDGKIKFHLQQTRFTTKNNADLKDFINYSEILKRNFDRTSPQHHELLASFAHDLLDIADKYKNDFSIDTEQLLTPVRPANITDREYLVSRIVNTFEIKGDVAIITSLLKPAQVQVSYLFKSVVYKTFSAYADENNMTYDEVKKIYNSDSDINLKNELTKRILNVYNRSLKGGNLCVGQRQIEYIAKEIFDFEQRDIGGLTNKYLTLNPDLAKKNIFNSSEVQNLLYDLIELRDGKDIATMKTTLGRMLYLTNEYIQEAQSKKVNLDTKNITDIIINKDSYPHPTINFKIKDVKDPLTLYELYDQYHIDLTSINYIINHYSALKSGQLSVDQIIENQAIIRTDYFNLCNLYTDTMHSENIDIDEDVFHSLGGTDKELNLLKDYELTRIYNTLLSNTFLDTVVEGDTTSKHSVNKLINLQNYLNEDVIALFAKSYKMFKSTKTEFFKLNRQLYNIDNVEKIFLLNLLSSKDINQSTKKFFLKHIFFYGAQVATSGLTKKDLSVLSEKIDANKKELILLKDNKDLYDAKLSDIASDELIYKQMQKEYEGLEQRKLFPLEFKEGKYLDTFIDHLLSRASLSDALIYYSGRLSANTPTVRAEGIDKEGNPTGIFYIVKYTDVNNNLNVTPIHKGIPKRNKYIGEHIIKYSDKNIIDYIQNILNSDISLTSYKQKLVPSYASDAGLVFVVDQNDMTMFRDSKTQDILKTALSLNKTQKNNLIFVTKEQLIDIEDMVYTGIYTTIESYRVKLDDKTGEILGKVTGVLNSKASSKEGLTPAFFKDVLNRLVIYDKNNDVDIQASTKLLERFKEYATLKQKHMFVEKAYTISSPLNRTETFENLYQDTRVHLLYSKFVQSLTKAGLNQTNIGLLSTMFFNNKYLDKDLNGNFFDLTQLSQSLDNPKLLYQLKNTTIVDELGNTKSILAAITTVLSNMQQEIKNNELYENLDINVSKLLNNSYLNTVEQLSDKVYSLLLDLKERNNRAYTQILTSLKAKEKLNLIENITYKEVQARNLYVSQQYKSALVSQQINFDSAIQLPYSNTLFPQANEVFTEGVKALLDFYNGRDAQTNEKNSYTIAYEASQIRQEYKETIARINEARLKKNTESKRSINWNTFKSERDAVIDALNKYEKEYKAGKQKQKLEATTLKFSEISDTLKQELQSFSEIIINKYNVAKGTKAPTEEQKHLITLIENIPYDVSNANGFTKAVTAFMVTNFYNLIAAYTSIYSYEDYTADAVMATLQNNMASKEDRLSTEELNKVTDQYFQNYLNSLKNRPYKFKPDEYPYYYELVTKDDGTQVLRNTGTPLALKAFKQFYEPFLTAEESESVLTKVTDLYIAIEEHLFKPAPQSMKDIVVNQTETTSSKTIRSYLDTIKDPVQKEFLEFWLEVGGDHLNRSMKTIDISKGVHKYNYQLDDETNFLYSPKHRRIVNIEEGALYELIKIRKQQRRLLKGFKDVQETYNLLKIPYLDNDETFKTFLNDSLFSKDGSFTERRNIFGTLGIKSTGFISRLETAKTINHMVNILKSDTEFKEDHMYALTYVINRLKRYYIENYFNKLKPTNPSWSWKNVEYEFVLRPLNQAKKNIQILHDTHTFDTDDRFGNNVLQQVKNETNIIFNSLKFISDNNNLLRSFIVDDTRTPTTSTTIDEQLVLVNESNNLKQNQIISREIIGSIFAPRDNYTSLKGLQLQELDRVLNAGDLELFTERHAKSLEDAKRGSSTYNNLREIFTKLLKLIYTDVSTKTQDERDATFVRIFDIGVAFQTFKENPDSVPLYEDIYDNYLAQTFTDEDIRIKHDTALQDIVDYFKNGSGFLTKAGSDIRFIKAAMSIILQQRFSINETNKYFTEHIKEYAENQTKYKEQIAAEERDSLSAHFSINHNEDELEKIFFTDLEEAKLQQDFQESYELFEYAKDLRNFINNTAYTLDPYYLDDSWDTAYLNAYGPYHEETAYVIKLRALHNKEEQIKKEYDATLKQHRKILKTLGLKEDFSTTDLEELTDVLNKSVIDANALIEQQELLLQQKENAIKQLQKKWLLKLYEALPIVHQSFSDNLITEAQMLKQKLRNVSQELQDKFSFYEKETVDLVIRQMLLQQRRDLFYASKSYQIYKEASQVSNVFTNGSSTLKIQLSSLHITRQTTLDLWLKAMSNKQQSFEILEQKLKATESLIRNNKTINILEQAEKLKRNKMFNSYEKTIQQLLSSTDNYKVIEALLGILDPRQKLALTTAQKINATTTYLNQLLDNKNYTIDFTTNTVPYKMDTGATIDSTLADVVRSLKANDITFKNASLSKIVSWLKRVTGRTPIKDSVEVANVKQTVTQLKEQQTETQQQIKDAEFLRTQYTALKEKKLSELQKVQQQIKETQNSLDTINKLTNKERLYGTSNIGTYKKLYSLDTDASEETVLKDVLNRYKNSIKGGINSLKKKILEYGQFTLHNPIVDTLITRCVRLAQWSAEGKPVPNIFYTFDMETIKDRFGNNTPYMMTFLIDEKGKTEVITYYINNPIFFAEEGTIYKPLLDAFYQQQRDIAKKSDPTKLDYNIDKETDELVNRVKNTPNLKEFVQTFIKLFTDASERKIPILAHNGFRFDFHNYDMFIAKTGQRLLANLYYQLLNKNEPNQIRQRLQSLDKDNLQLSFDERYIKELDKTFEHLLDNPSLVRSEDIRILKDIVAKRYATKLSIHWTDAARRYNLLLDEESETSFAKLTDDLVLSLNNFLLNKGTAEEQKQSQEQFIRHFVNAAQERGVANLEAFEKQIKDSLVSMKVDFDAIMNAEKKIDYTQLIKSIKQRVYEEVTAETPEEIKQVPSTFDHAGKLKAYQVMENTIDDTISALKGTANIRSILNQYETKINANEEQITVLTNKLNELNKVRDTLKDAKQNTLTAYQKTIEHLDRVLGNPVYQSKMLFNKELDYDDRHNTNGFTDSLLTINIQQTRLLKQAYETIQSLKQFIAAIQNKSLEEINRDIQQGKFNLTLFNFRTIEERNEYIHTLELDIKTLQTALDTSGNLTQDFHTASILHMEQNIAAIKDQLDLMIKKLQTNWNVNKTDSRKLQPTEEQKYSPTYYLDFLETIKRNYHKDETGLVELLEILKKGGNFFKLLNLYNTKDIKEASPTLVEMITASIKQEIDIKTSLLDHAKQSQLLTGTDKELKETGILETISENFNSAFNKVVDAYRVNLKKEAVNLYNVLDNKKHIIKDTISFEEAAPLANKYYNYKQIQELDIKTSNGSKREYYNLRNDFDKRGMYIKKDALVGVASYGETSEEDTYRIGYVNNDNDTFNNISISSKNPGNPVLNIRYAYHTQDSFLLQRPKIYEESIRLYKQMYDDETGTTNWVYQDPRAYIERKIKSITKNVEVYNPDGIDESLEAINRLLTLFEKHENSFKHMRKLKQEYKVKNLEVPFKEYQEILEPILKDVNWDNELSSNVFEALNISEHIKSQLQRHLDILAEQNKTITPEELFDLRTGLYQKYYAKYSATSPNSYIMMIPREFSENYLIKYTDEDIDRLNVSLISSSENSAGASHMVNTFYEFSVPFRQGVNVARTVLSYNKLLGMSTPSFLINAGYSEEDNYGTKLDFMDYFADPDKDYELSKDFLEHNNIKDDDDKTILKQLLLHKYNGKYINAFTPHVLTNDMNERYKKDILHKLGVNIPVAVAEDNRAHEDVTLYDTSYAAAQRIENGSKMWVGEYYGSKGAQFQIDDLYDTYGAVALIRSGSVVSRSTRGMDIALAISNIRSVLVDDLRYLPNNIKDFIQLHLDSFKQYFTVDPYGKLIVDENKDYLTEVFAKLIANLNDTTIQTGEQLIEKLIYTEPKNKNSTYKIYNEQKQKYETYKVPNRIKFGTMYVMQDAAHTPADMNINARVVSEYEISTVYKNYLDSVQDGVVISPSVIQTIRAKGNVDWNKAFPANLQKTTLYAEIGQKGAEAILDLYRASSDNIEPDAVALASFMETELKTPSLVSKMINYLHYKQILTMPDTNSTLKQFADYQLQKINLAIKEMVKTIVTKQNGALYQSFYYKHEGIRQQLVANTLFKTGTMALGRVGFHTMIQMKEGWLQSEKISDTELKEIQDNLPYKDIKPKDLTSKQLIAQLDHYNRFGILTDTINGKSNFEFKDAEWYNGDSSINRHLKSIVGYTLKENPTRYYGYVLGIRSPVQDYNAVPMMKVVGYAPHHAVEANAYLYTMIGGDNDGDTLGIVALDMKQVDALAKPDSTNPSKRLGLDATNPDYYDEEYIADISKKFKEEDAKSSPYYDVRYNYAGKNTFKFDKKEIPKFKAFYKQITNKDLKNFIVRDHYSWWEFYFNTINSPALEKSLNDVTEDEVQHDILSDEQSQFYLDVIYKNFDLKTLDQKDIITLMHKLNIFEQRINTNSIKRYKPEESLTVSDIERFKTSLSKEDIISLENISNNIILTKDKYTDIRKRLIFNKIYNESLKKTIMRFRVSKLGINFFGNIRKKIFEKIHILTAPHINTDVKEHFFNDNIEHYNGTLTFESIKVLIQKGLTVDADTLENKLNSTATLAGFQTWYQSHVNHTRYKGADEQIKVLLNELVELVYNNRQECIKLVTELTSFDKALRALYNNKDVSLLIEHFNQGTDAFRLENNPLLQQLLLDLQNNPRTHLNSYEKAILNSAYFGKDLKQLDSFADNIKYYAEQHAKQLIFTREQYRTMSNEATRIIAIAKHEGINTDAAKFLNKFARDLKSLYKKTTTNPRIVNMNKDDYIFSLGILADSNVLERLENPFDIETDEVRKSNENINQVLEITKEHYSNIDNYEKEDIVINNLNTNITKALNIELLNKPKIPPEIQKDLQLLIEAVFKVFSINKGINNQMAALESVKIKNLHFYKGLEVRLVDALMQYDLSAYKFERFYERVLSLYDTANKRYINATNGKILNISKITTLINGAAFYRALETIRNPGFKQQLLDTRSQYSSSVRFFLSELSVDLNYLEKDDSGNIIRRYNNNKTYSDVREQKQYSDSLYSEMFDNLQPIETKEEYNKQKLIADSYGVSLKNIGVSLTRSEQTLESLLNIFKDNFEDIKQALKDNADTQIAYKGIVEENIVSKALNYASKDVYSVTKNIIDLNKKEQLKQKYLTFSKQIDSIENQINTLRTEINTKELLIKRLQESMKYEEQYGDSNKIINSLEQQKLELLKNKQILVNQVAKFAFNNHFTNFISVLKNADGHTRNEMLNQQDQSKQILNGDRVKSLSNSAIIKLAEMQTPFLNMLSFYEIYDKVDSKKIIGYDWEKMYKEYRAEHDTLRLTIVMDPFKDETLVKKLYDFIYLDKSDWKALTKKQQIEFKDFKTYFKKGFHFNSFEQIVDLMKLINGNKNFPSLRLGGQPISSIDNESVKVTNYVTPTLKEIEISSGDDLRKVYEYIKTHSTFNKRTKSITGAISLIGFVNLNNLLSAMDLSYKPVRFNGGAIARLIAQIGFVEKLLMRFNPAFLTRNFFDTWFQLFTERFTKADLAMFVLNGKRGPKALIDYMIMTNDIYDIYNALNSDRLITLREVDLNYINLQKLLSKGTPKTEQTIKLVEQNLQQLKNVLVDYKNAISDADAKTKERLDYRITKVNTLIPELDSLLTYTKNIIPSKQDIKTKLDDVGSSLNLEKIKKSVTFILNMKFGEYFLVYDTIKPDTHNHSRTINSHTKKYRKQGTQSYEDFKTTLFEISAFMSTNALIDEYQTKLYDDLRDFEQYEKLKKQDSQTELSYDDAVKDIRKNFNSKLKTVISYATMYEPYKLLNERIEITGRIAGFLYDRYINNESFDRATSNSLKRFFNYGQRSSLEKSMMANIPYLSFPIRSIRNWIDRLTDPRFIVLMSDLIDGAYGQYQNENGQYSEFEKFMIESGWLPMFNGIGIRFGNGAFDIQRLLSNPSSLLDRSRPLLKGISTLINNNNLTDAMKQLATAGVITNVANFITGLNPILRTDAQEDKVMQNIVNKKAPTIGNTLNIFFDYNEDKYTPYKYRRSKNGRYAYYENIYRDWFTKYGRMRKPTVDPYSLVKNIQWKQYVKWRQSKALLNKK